MEDHSESVTSDSLSQLKILSHDGYSLSVNGAQVSVFEKGDQVSFSSLLQSQNCLTLESHFLLVFHSDLSHDSLER